MFMRTDSPVSPRAIGIIIVHSGPAVPQFDPFGKSLVLNGEDEYSIDLDDLWDAFGLLAQIDALPEPLAE